MVSSSDDPAARFGSPESGNREGEGVGGPERPGGPLSGVAGRTPGRIKISLAPLRGGGRMRVGGNISEKGV